MEKILGYEEAYHNIFHKHLLTNGQYYQFRARYAKDFYWKYFDLDGEVMEFGVGLGQNIFLNKHRAFGVDISSFCAKQCAKRGIKVLKDIAKVKPASLSGVLCCHCMEHLDNPSFFLREFFRVLKLKGRLVLLLPVESYDINKRTPSETQHLFAWNLQTACNLLHTAGFKIRIGKFNYATGFSRFYKLPFPIAAYFVRVLGMLTDTKELLVVAEKA